MSHVSFKSFCFNLSDVKSLKYSGDYVSLNFYDNRKEKIVCTKEEYEKFLNEMYLKEILKVVA